MDKYQSGEPPAPRDSAAKSDAAMSVDVKVYPMQQGRNDKSNLLAYASVTLGGCFAVNPDSLKYVSVFHISAGLCAISAGFSYNFYNVHLFPYHGGTAGEAEYRRDGRVPAGHAKGVCARSGAGRTERCGGASRPGSGKGKNSGGAVNVSAACPHAAEKKRYEKNL